MKEPHLLSKGGWSAHGGDGGAQSGDARREGCPGVQVQCRNVIIITITIAKPKANTNKKEQSLTASGDLSSLSYIPMNELPLFML